MRLLVPLLWLVPVFVIFPIVIVSLILLGVLLIFGNILSEGAMSNTTFNISREALALLYYMSMITVVFAPLALMTSIRMS